jgi:hypothetical protein
MLADIWAPLVTHNCDRVRSACPVRFLQVRPDPYCADNVQLRIGQGPFTTMHVLDALAFVRLVYRRQRRLNIRAGRTAPGAASALPRR